MDQDAASATGSFPIRLGPSARLRVNNFVGAAVIAGLGVFAMWGALQVGLSTERGGWILLILGVPMVLYGLALLPGTLWMEVILYSDHVLVRGYLGIRRISRDAITGVTAYPSIVWNDKRGRRRTTRVNALNVYRSGWASPNPDVVSNVDNKIDVLAAWAGVK